MSDPRSFLPLSPQQFHILRNRDHAALSPWFDAAALDGAGLRTPEWRPFHRPDLRRFDEKHSD